MQFIDIETVRLIQPLEAAECYWPLVIRYDEVVEKTKERKMKLNEYLDRKYFIYDYDIKTFRSTHFGNFKIKQARELANLYCRQVKKHKDKLIYNVDRIVINSGDIKNTPACELKFKDEKYGFIYKNGNYKMLPCAWCLEDKKFVYKKPNAYDYSYTDSFHKCKTCERLMCEHCNHFVHCWFCKYEFDNGIKEKPKAEKKDKKVIVKRKQIK